MTSPPSSGRGSDVSDLAARMSDWHVIDPNAAVHLCRGVQWLFERGLYRFGVRGATTVGKFATRAFRNRTATFENGTGARFAFPAWDSYYGHYLYLGHEYEPELTTLLAAHAANPAASFLDCGANYGYWSVLAARVLAGPIAAIELSPQTIEWLRLNAHAADRPIEVLNAAVWDEDGVAMAIAENGPNQSHSAHLAESSPAVVRSRSIDSVVSELALAPEHLLVKIDCEGAEIRTLAGAADTAARGGSFVLEDHGSDPECLVSRRLFELGWNVAIFETAVRRWKPVSTVEAVRAVKTDPERGYNVLAWSGKLQPTLEAATS